MELFKLFGTIGLNGVSEFNSEVDGATDNTQKSGDKMNSAFAKIGAAVAATFAVDKIVDFGKACVDAAVNISAQTAAFTQIMGDYSDQAQAKIAEIADTTGIVDGRLTPYITSMTAKFQGLGYDIGSATDLASVGLTIAADAAAFWDKTLDDSMSHLNSFINGSYEGGEAIGLFANETTLASWSAENLGLEWSKLTEKDKQFARLEFAKAMQEASGVTGQASAESDAYANVLGNLAQKWQEFKAEIGTPILQNVVIPVMMRLQDVLTGANDRIQALTEFLRGAFAPVSEEIAKIMDSTIVSKLRDWISSDEAASASTTVLQSVIETFAVILQGVGIVIETVINIIQALIDAFNWCRDTVQNLSTSIPALWEKIKSDVTDKINTIASKVQSKFEEIRSNITDKIEAAREAVREAIDKIKGFFDFDWELPHIKLPHFSITGTFSLAPPSTPKFGIDWYAKGAVLNSPTIFGMNGNHLMAGGEAGAEAVAPIDVLQGYVAAAVAEQNDKVAVVLNKILEAIADLDNNMGASVRNALEGTALKINNREFGRLVRGTV